MRQLLQLYDAAFFQNKIAAFDDWIKPAEMYAC
jgi:hypothetical protein